MVISRLRENNFQFRPFEVNDTYNLLMYLENLSPETKQRFSPHPFTTETISNLFHDTNNYRLFLAINLKNSYIEAYILIKLGWIEFEQSRYKSYSLTPTPNDCTIAPSVADFWQGKGLGSLFFDYIKKELLSTQNINRYFLWGGVQSENTKALIYYKKHNFKTLGYFIHNGKNIDMLLDLSQ